MTDNNQRLFAADVLALAAVDLWSSSTAGRYFRLARRGFHTSPLRETLWAVPGRMEDVVTRARTLLSNAVGATERTLDEVELALLVAAMERTPNDSASEVLRLLAVSTEPVLGWVANLARDGLARHASNKTIAASRSGSRPIAGARADAACPPKSTNSWQPAAA